MNNRSIDSQIEREENSFTSPLEILNSIQSKIDEARVREGKLSSAISSQKSKSSNKGQNSSSRRRQGIKTSNYSPKPFNPSMPDSSPMYRTEDCEIVTLKRSNKGNKMKKKNQYEPTFSKEKRQKSPSNSPDGKRKRSRSRKLALSPDLCGKHKTRDLRDSIKDNISQEKTKKGHISDYFEDNDDTKQTSWMIKKSPKKSKSPKRKQGPRPVQNLGNRNQRKRNPSKKMNSKVQEVEFVFEETHSSIKN